jgi:EmrB/QacA subfamily drug resistance transporter
MQMTSTNRRWVMTAVLLVTFLAAIEGTVLNTALPVIVGELGGWNNMSWVVSIYLLATASMTPISGFLADRFGRKPMILVGISLFLFGTICCGMAQSIGQLIFFRAWQGLGSGFIVPITYTIVADIYPFEHRARAQSWISTVWGVAAVISPFTGGFIVDHVSWRWIFYAGVPVGLLAASIIWRFFHESESKQNDHVNWSSIVLFVLAISSLMYGIQETNALPVPDYIFFIVAAVFIALFVYTNHRSQSPLIPLRLMRNPAILVPNTADFLLNAILVSMNFYIPLWVQGIYGFGAVGSGLMLLAMSIAWPVSAAATGTLIRRYGTRTTSLIGHMLIVIGTFGLLFQQLRIELEWLVILLVFMGSGFGIAFTVHIVSVQSSVQWQERGRAVSSNNLMRQMGQAIGISTLGTMLAGNVSMLLESKSDSDMARLRMDDLFNSETVANMPEASIQLLRDVLAYGMQPIFIVLIVLAVLSMLISLRLPKEITEI